MLPLYEALEARMTGKRSPVMRHASVDLSVTPGAISKPDYVETFNVSALFSIEQQAPADAYHVVLDRARRMIGHEVYGEVRHRLIEIEHELYLEGYRHPSNPVLTKLHKLLRLLEGEE